MVFFAGIILVMLGAYCVTVKKNLIKIVMGIFIIECGINLLIVAVGYRSGAHAPILEKGAGWVYLDPVPQALALLSIMIGLSTLMLAVSISMRLYERYGTFDIRDIRKLKG